MAARWSRLFAGRRVAACGAASAAVAGLTASHTPRPWVSGDHGPQSRPEKGIVASASSLRSSAAVQCDTGDSQRLRYGTITLRDGRRLAYHEEGSGVPVFALHGMGSSRLTWVGKQPLSELCPGVRLIAVDRPGYGGSSPPGITYSYTAFAEDLAELADALQLPRFCVAGHSSGGPYALAAAAVLKERVASVAAVSSDAPYCHPLTPAELRNADDMVQHRDVDSMGMYGQEPRAVVEAMRASTLAKGTPVKAHAWKVGVEGFLCDYMLERLPYSFLVESITLGPRLTIWYGSKDINAIMVGSPFLQQLVSGSQLRVVEGGNHGFKSEPQHLAAILSELKKWF